MCSRNHMKAPSLVEATVGPLLPSCSRKVPSCTAEGVKRETVGLPAHHFSQHAHALVNAASREAVNLAGSFMSKCFCSCMSHPPRSPGKPAESRRLKTGL